MTVGAWHRIWAFYDRIDQRITATLARLGIPALRISLGIVFLWFGVHIVLVAAATVVGATVRGGRLTPEPPRADPA